MLVCMTFFIPRFNESRRGHDYKLYLPTCKSNIRSNEPNGSSLAVCLHVYPPVRLLGLLVPARLVSHTPCRSLSLRRRPQPVCARRPSALAAYRPCDVCRPTLARPRQPRPVASATILLLYIDNVSITESYKNGNHSQVASIFKSLKRFHKSLASNHCSHIVRYFFYLVGYVALLAYRQFYVFSI